MSQKLKVLLVDDDTAVIKLMSAKLEKYFDVISTTKPAAVVGIAIAEKPDLILCDINMPDMKGDEVAFHLSDSRETHHIPLIYLSAVVPDEDAYELDDAFGGFPAVSKSAPLADLLRVIEQVTVR